VTHRIPPATMIQIAEQRLAGRTICSLAAQYGIGEFALACRLGALVPSCYFSSRPRYHYNPQAEPPAERIGNAI
jgi:hypothetical protein